MRISIKLKETAKQIEAKIHQALVDKINQKLKLGQNKAIQKARSYVKRWVLSQPEMQSIAMGGSLAGEFGIPTGQGGPIAESVATAVSLATTFEFTPFNNKFKGSAILNFQPLTFANLLSLPTGYVNTLKSGRLHWMDWILIEGNKTIVVGYEYVPEGGEGRSGLGKMSKGTMWRVPPQFAGTRQDNFITRAFLGKEKQIASLFAEIVR